MGYRKIRDTGPYGIQAHKGHRAIKETTVLTLSSSENHTVCIRRVWINLQSSLEEEWLLIRVKEHRTRHQNGISFMA